MVKTHCFRLRFFPQPVHWVKPNFSHGSQDFEDDKIVDIPDDWGDNLQLRLWNWRSEMQKK